MYKTQDNKEGAVMKNGIIEIKHIKKVEAEKKEAARTMEENIRKIVQVNGYMELRKYEELVNKFIDDISKLSVFEKIFDDFYGNKIRFVLIDEVLNSLVKPVFEGNRPDFMKEEHFDLVREEMYANIIKRYVDDYNKIF